MNAGARHCRAAPPAPWRPLPPLTASISLPAVLPQRRFALLLLATLPALAPAGDGHRRPGDPAGPARPPRSRRVVLPTLPRAAVLVDSERHELVIELPPVDLAASRGHEMAMVLEPTFEVEITVSGSIWSYRVEVVDSGARELPKALLHHFNLRDPDRRDLFLPIGMQVMAASKETPPASVPWLLFGLPFERGQRMIASAMLGNETPVAYRGVRVRLVLRYVPAHRPWPLFRAYPWGMDVQYPLGERPGGSKAFDLPPGRTVRSWESSPAVPGTLLGMGGHVHDYGVSIELRDVTTGEVICREQPRTDSRGAVVSLPLVRFYRWNRLGVHILPEHRYRITAVYENPTGHLLHDGGMGAVGGLFVPDRGTTWPAVEPADSVYQSDLYHTLWPPGPISHMDH